MTTLGGDKGSGDDDLIQLVDKFLFQAKFIPFLDAEMAQRVRS